MSELTDAEWHEIRVECAPPTDYGILRGLIDAAIDARLAPIRALADEWEQSTTWDGRIEPVGRAYGKGLARALSADLTAPQPASGTQGQQ